MGGGLKNGDLLILKSAHASILLTHAQRPRKFITVRFWLHLLAAKGGKKNFKFFILSSLSPAYKTKVDSLHFHLYPNLFCGCYEMWKWGMTINIFLDCSVATHLAMIQQIKKVVPPRDNPSKSYSVNYFRTPT